MENEIKMYDTYVNIGPQIEIGNNKLQIRIDKSSGRLIGIKNKVTKDEYVKNAPRNSGMPFAILCRGNGSSDLWFDARDQRVSDVKIEKLSNGCRVVKIFYQNLLKGVEKYDIELKYSIRVFPQNEESLWQIEIVNNDKKVSVLEVVFPSIYGIYLGKTYEDDVLVFPLSAGIRVRNPVSEFVKSPVIRRFTCAFHGTPHSFIERGVPTRKIENGIHVLEGLYCGGTSMMWFDYYDMDQGLYMASYDRDFLVTCLHVETPGPTDPRVDFYIKKYVFIPYEEKWSSYPYSVGVHSGDWHWGADRYRKWAKTVLKNPEVPRWFKENDALIAHYDLKYASSYKGKERIGHRYEDLPKLYKEANKEGIDHLFIGGWYRGGHDGCCPEYFPDLELGSPIDFRNSIKKITEMNGHVTFYTNARLFNLHCGYFERLGRTWAAKDANGNIYKESYGVEKFAVMCSGCSEWKKLMHDYAMWLVEVIGATGVYFDQIGAASPKVCYDFNHEHGPHPSLWNSSYADMLKEINEDFKRKGLDVITMIEGCGDIYGPYVTAHLISFLGSWVFPSLFRYTFPEYMLVAMANLYAIEKDLNFDLDKLHMEFIHGMYFWIWDPFPNENFFIENKDWWEHFKKILKLRETARPFITNGKFKDNIGVEVSDDTVQAKLFELKNEKIRGKLVTLWNKQHKSNVKIIVNISDLKDVKVFKQELGGNVTPLDHNIRDDKVEFLAPTSVVSIVIIKE